MTTLRSLVAGIAVGLLAAGAHSADGPIPMRQLAPDSTYLLVSADAWSKALESWDKTGLHALLQIEPLKGIFGAQGAAGSVEERVKELGAPAGSATWPDAFGASMYTAHNNELDTDEGHFMLYGDWGVRADAFSQLVDAAIAEAVKKDGWKVASADEIAGRKVTAITLSMSDKDKAIRQRFGEMGLEFTTVRDTFYYMRDGTRFLLGTDRAGLEDVIEAVDGKRKCALPDAKDYQAATDQLGAQDLSVVLLTGPMQKALAGEGMGMLAMVQPLIQPLFGDVQAWCFGLDVQGERGQVELTQTVLVPGQKAGVWSLVGPSVPIEPPPPMIGPDAISYARFNVQFKEIMNLVNTVAANDPQMSEFLDPWLLNFGPAVTKGLEAMGPGMWMSSQVRQPMTPESLVSSTVIACSNPKAVVPMLTQLGAPVGMEPRDVDGNTIFSSDAPPMAIGVSNGYMAMGDTKQVEQAMRSVGQKDLPSIAENPAFKRALGSAGTDAVVGWGYSDMVARWAFDREMIKLAAKDGGTLPRMISESDDSSWAKRMGYELPEDALEKLATLEPATLAKHIGPLVWTCRMGDKGLVTRMWLMAPAAE